MSTFFDIILIAMALYVLVGGITGKGRLYQLDNVKEGMEEKFHSRSRKLFIALGSSMLLNSVSSLLLIQFYTYDENYQLTIPEFDLGVWSFLTPKLLQVLTYVGFGLMIGLLVLFCIMTTKMTDRNAPPKKKQNSSNTNRNGGKERVKLPSHAFDFSEFEQAADEKTVKKK